MSVSGDSAEQVVKITFEGVEVLFRIAGKGVEGVAKISAFIAAALKDTSVDSPGKKTLREMIRSGKPTNFFELQAKDLRAFAEQAKKYGVHYHMLDRTPDDPNALVDLMAWEEDAPKINRIIERFQLAGVEIGKAEQEENPAPELGVQEKTENERLLDEIVQPKENSNRNPTAAKTEPANPSEPSSRKRGSADRNKKPSVREHLQEIREAQKAAKPETPQIEVPHIELKGPELSR